MIAKQPNGLYCRVSAIVDAPTHTNMNLVELEAYLDETNQMIDYGERLTIEEWLERYERAWNDAFRAITTLNMTKKEIKEWLALVGDTSDSWKDK